MEEIWKDIPQYEGMYQVSNLGRVKSLERYKDNHSKQQLVPERILAQSLKDNGYQTVSLWKNNKGKNEYVHRLVAMAFLPNPNGLPQVNHKDENKANNTWTNLEWCDSSYNNNYGTKRSRQGETLLNNGKTSKRVAKCDLEGNELATYRSMREAERENGLANGAISAYFKYNREQTGGYTWRIIPVIKG